MDKVLGKAKSVRELLSGAKYAIDYYQREYKWERKQVAELLDDLTSKFRESHVPTDDRGEVEKYSHYFLGSIIISQKDGVNYIVDGQQRLTTLTLLLIYLNHLQHELLEDQRVKIDELIYSAKYGKKSFNIQVEEREACMNALFEVTPFDAESQPEAIRNLVARYDDIGELFPDEIASASLPFFIDWLIENVHLVEITAFSDNDAYTIFETMNDRGLSLSQIDMLKGFLLANIQDPKKRTACNDLWKRRVQELGSKGKDVDNDCFKSWLRSRHAKTIRERTRDSEPGDFDRIGSEFHRWVRDVKDGLELDGGDSYSQFILRDFDFYSRQYLRLLEASRKYTPGLEHVFFNAQAGFTLQPMLLLAPIAVTDAESTINLKWRIASLYLDILLARRIWNYRSTDQSTMKYPIFATMLDIRGLAPEDMSVKLLDHLTATQETLPFNGQFALHGMNRRQITRILARMTAFVETRSGYTDQYLAYTTGASTKRFEVEHIWANKFERHSDEFSHPSDFGSYRNRIGGLLLLPKSFNASYGDLPYPEKQKHYFGQNLLARSLHPDCYEHNPGFLRFMEETELPFKAHMEFRKTDLDQRQDLYQRLADVVWNADQLLDIVTS